jgi:hypothetical protein
LCGLFGVVFFGGGVGGGVMGWGYEFSCVLGGEGGVYGCVLC